ncbi:MAG: MarR family winged helix-turn-helix transcriptional regulator [Henriciella sp.]
MRVHRTSRLLTRRYDDAIRPTGLTITQFTLLNTIALQRPDSISDIGSRLDIDRTTLSRSLSLLQDAGFVALGEPGADRKRAVLLTPKGQEKLAEAYELWQGVQDEVEALLDEEELSALNRALAKLRQG